MISVVIPTLNEIAAIEKTLKQFRSTSRMPLEIIVSDGNSTDGTIELAKRLADKVVVYRGTRRQTIAMGRNLGAREAIGEFLVFTDADVLIFEPDAFFERLLRVFETDRQVLAVTVKMRILPEFSRLIDRVIFSVLNWFYLVQNNFFRIGAAGGEFQMVRRAAFEKLGGYREDLAAGEDHDLYRRISKIGKTRFVSDLAFFHSNRRVRKVGWPKLLWLWSINSLSVIFLGRAFSKVWKEIR